MAHCWGHILSLEMPPQVCQSLLCSAATSATFAEMRTSSLSRRSSSSFARDRPSLFEIPVLILINGNYKIKLEYAKYVFLLTFYYLSNCCTGTIRCPYVRRKGSSHGTSTTINFVGLYLGIVRWNKSENKNIHKCHLLHRWKMYSKSFNCRYTLKLI